MLGLVRCHENLHGTLTSITNLAWVERAKDMHLSLSLCPVIFRTHSLGACTIAGLLPTVYRDTRVLVCVSAFGISEAFRHFIFNLLGHMHANCCKNLRSHVYYEVSWVYRKNGTHKTRTTQTYIYINLNCFAHSNNFHDHPSKP